MSKRIGSAISLTVVLFLHIVPVLAQTAPPPSNLFRDLVHNTLFVGQQPTTMFGLLAMGATPAAFGNETNRLYHGWTDHQSIDHVFELGNVMGQGAVHFGAALSLYAVGKLSHHEQAASLGSDLFSALAISGFVSSSLKLVTHRRRPDGAPYSFPSGHATMAFTTAGVIANRFGTVPGIAAEAAATYVALSRLQENKHYISDVVAGCVIGNYVAHAVVHRRQALAAAAAIGFSPVTATGDPGAALTLRF